MAYAKETRLFADCLLWEQKRFIWVLYTLQYNIINLLYIYSEVFVVFERKFRMKIDAAAIIK